MVSTIDTIDLDGDEEIDIRGWIRTFADSGKPIYVGIYTSFRHEDRGYVSVGFPIPSANFTATLLPRNAGEHDLAADLAHRARRSPGHYLSSVDSERDALTVLKLLAFQEQIHVYVADGELQDRPQLLARRPALPDAALRDRAPRAGPLTRRRPPRAGVGLDSRDALRPPPPPSRPARSSSGPRARSRSSRGRASSSGPGATSSTSRSASPTSPRPRTSPRRRSPRSARARPATARRAGIPELREAAAAELSRTRGVPIGARARPRRQRGQAVPVLRRAGDLRARRRGDLPRPRLPDLRVGDPLRRRDARPARRCARPTTSRSRSTSSPRA